MYKLLVTLLLTSTYLIATVDAIVSIIPQSTILHAIGGDKVNITLMVQAGDSPHSYEPKPSQMIAIAQADLYLAIGVEFEQAWLPKFKDLNSKMFLADITKDIEKIPMLDNHHTHKEHKVANTDEHPKNDPHVWTSPSNVKIIAKNIYNALTKVDKKNTNYYRHNLDTFLSKVTQTDHTIKEILASHKENRTFLVFHPSWGYFAKEYHLKQVAMEVEGKNPKPKALVKLIKEAKKKKINAIFTQAEFSDASAKIIANELHIPVVKISPMAPNWSENLIFIAKTITGKK